MKNDGHLRTRGKCSKHEPQASVFYISRVFSNVWIVLSVVVKKEQGASVSQGTRGLTSVQNKQEINKNRTCAKQLKLTS